MEHLVTRFADHFMLALYVLMVVDTTGLPLPSELPLFYGGYLISQGRLDIVPAGLVAAAGALTGSLIAYVISRSVGRTVVLRWGKYVFLTEEHLHRSERWFERRGPAAVFFCRMIPVARAVISIPAGIAEMEPMRFAVYSFAGALPWAFGLLGAGWALGSRWKEFLGSFSLASIAIGIVLIVVIAWWLVRRRRASREPEVDRAEV
jgi:membrane protein DedA with SNARE-associated domain